MSQKALNSFISMNFVPNLGMKGGHFKESDSNISRYEKGQTIPG